MTYFIPTFDHAHPIIISYLEFLSPFKKSVYSIDSLIRYSQFKSLVTRVDTPIFDYTHRCIFLSTLNFWCQHEKKQTFSSLCSKDTFDIKILQSGSLAKAVLTQYDCETN